MTLITCQWCSRTNSYLLTCVTWAVSDPRSWTTARPHRVAISVWAELSLTIDPRSLSSDNRLVPRLNPMSHFRIDFENDYYRLSSRPTVVKRSLPVNLTWTPPVRVSKISPWIDSQNIMRVTAAGCRFWLYKVYGQNRNSTASALIW